MDTKTAIEEFKLRIVSPLIADLTRTLEVTCNKSGEDNHGSNFIGNAVILIGIETVAQFINVKTGISIKEVENNFPKCSRKLYRVKGNLFCLCPQVLFVYFKKAIKRFTRRILRDKELETVFLENYRRLAPVYRFTIGKEAE